MFVTNLDGGLRRYNKRLKITGIRDRLDSVPAEVEQLMQELLANRYQDDHWSVLNPEST